MTNEPKPCRKGDDDQLALELERLAEILARDGCTKWCVDTARAGSQRIAQIGIASTRPSPAPNVSVEECVEAARVALRSEIPDVSDELTSPTSDELTCIAAVHALCVSRLTGAATRSETIEELALDLVNKWRESSGMRKRSNWAKTVSRDDDYDGGREPWLAVARCALASHPASVAGEARPSDDEVWTAFDDARRRAKVLRTSSQEQDAAGLRAVMELYERGAK